MKTLKEKHIHGTALFPFELFNQKFPEKFTACYVHWHPEVEWIYVVTGKIMIVIDGKEYILTADQFIMIEPNSIHYVYSIDASHYFTLVFNKELLLFSFKDRISTLYVDPYVRNETTVADPIDTKETPLYELFLNIIYFNSRKSKGYEMSIRLTLIQILLYLIESDRLVKRKEVCRELENMEKTLTYIKEHFSEKLTSTELAHLARYNPQYFSRYFKSYTGFSPIEYINRFRIEQACRLLAVPEMSIIDISNACGFENCSYFNKKFKAIKNMKPTEYRQKAVEAYRKDFTD